MLCNSSVISPRINPFIEPQLLTAQAEKLKARIRAKVEHPFRVL
jgi:IS5 family transposase